MKRRKTVDWELIMSFDPCPAWYEDRVRGAVPKRISLVRFLLDTSIPPADRLWVALHNVFLTDRTMRLFACDCAERALMRERSRGREPDPRLWAAVDVARRYAAGEATKGELAAARDAAWDAAWDAAGYAARAAARAAAWEAARDAARDAAGYAAGYAEREWQCAHLAEMLEAI